MKLFRFLLQCLAWVIALAAVLVVAAFVPTVQTWIAQSALDRQPAFEGSLGSLGAGFGKVEVADLRLKIAGAILTLPSLEAELPITTALWNRRILLRRLVAKGWTLDLRRIAETPGTGEPTRSAPEVKGEPDALAQAEAVPELKVVRMFRGTLSRWALPCDVSLDEVDLEGDVLVATPSPKVPSRVHVIIKGGGAGAGREGSFTIEASNDDPDADPSATTLTGRGRLVVAMNSPRTFSRIEVKADLSAQGGSLPKALKLSAEVAAALEAGKESYFLELSRGRQHLATVRARFPEAMGQLKGAWSLDLRDSDIAPFLMNHPLPHFAATGEGQFDSDAAFARQQVSGRLSAAVNHLGVLSPFLERLGSVKLDADFDAVGSRQSLQVNRLNVTLTGARPVAVVQSLQPFDLAGNTGKMTPVDPASDWIKISIRGFPLAWLSGSSDGFGLSGGDATGEFVVRARKEGFTLRPMAPVTAAGVSVQRAGRTLGRKLDLSLSLLADCGPQGWQIQAAPLLVSSGGRRLATLETKASQVDGPDRSVAITGSWNADLNAVASEAVAPDFSWITGRSAAGEFSARVARTTEFDGKLAVVGRDEHRSITANLHAEVDGGGRISFLAPVKVAFGPSVSDLSVEGTSIRDGAGTRNYAKLTGKDVVLEHLRLLAVPLAATAGPEAASGIRDQIPFWGDWSGHVTVALDHLRSGDQAFHDVGGVFQVEPGSVRLDRGHGRFGAQRFENVEGSLSFDAAAEFPYNLKAKASLDRIEAASFFPAAEADGQPGIEGHFSAENAVVGQGINLRDLIARAQEEFRLTSTGLIVRVLKTDVNEAVPEVGSWASDTLNTVGSAVGKFFGVKRAKESGENPVSPTAEAVIEFTNEMSQLGFEQVAVTAIRGSDGTIRLADIALTARDERLTGSGQITYAKGLSFRAQPISLDLQLGARGRIAKLLATAGLLSTRKDDLGYKLLNQPIHLGGTLEHIDLSQWHKLLVKAAAPNPPAPPKKVP